MRGNRETPNNNCFSEHTGAKIESVPSHALDLRPLNTHRMTHDRVGIRCVLQFVFLCSHVLKQMIIKSEVDCSL